MFYLPALRGFRLIQQIGLAVAVMVLGVGITSMTSVKAFAKPAFVPSPPKINATAYALMSAKTGKIIVSHNLEERLPPASLTKLMTSYIVAAEMEKGQISEMDQVPISVEAWKKGGSKMFVREGSKVVLSDLLKGMIIQSGNDASIALAEYVAGSEDAFADLMNQYAQELDMFGTQYRNATGWPDAEHYTTTQDLLTLTQHLITRFPNHYEYYRQKTFTYNEITQNNRNSLLFRDDSVDGVKTGHTDEAGYCLVSSALRDEVRLIAVVMGTDSHRSRNSESQKLLNYGFRFFEDATVVEAGDVLAVAPVWMGMSKELSLGLEQGLTMTLPRGHADTLERRVVLVENIQAPIVVGQPLGEVFFELNGDVIAEQPLVALADIEQAGFMTRVWHFMYLKVSSWWQ